MKLVQSLPPWRQASFFLIPGYKRPEIRSIEKISDCEAQLAVDVEKHESGSHLANVMDRGTNGAEEFEKQQKATKSSTIVWNKETLNRNWASQNRM